MRRSLLSVCAVLSGLSLAAGQSEGTRDNAGPAAVAVVVHKSCTMDSLSVAELRKMLLGDLRTWPDDRRIVLIEQPDESSVQQRMLRLLLGTNPAGYKRQLLEEQFQGKDLPLIKILNGDDNAIKFVWNVPGAIALVATNSAAANSSRVKILRVDGKAPGESGYLLQ